MPYTVRAGDTLGQIAAQLGVADWRDLFVGTDKAGDTDPRQLQIGATIFTPEEGAGGTGGETAAAPEEGDNPAVEDGTNEGVGATLASGADTAEAEAQTQEGVGGFGVDPETQLTILTGQEMVWSFDASTGKWYVRYGLPDSNLKAVFEADPDQLDALFGKGRRPVAYEGMDGGLAGLLQRPGMVFAGNVAEMQGTGSFEAEVAKVKALALDNGVLPKWAQDDAAAFDIVYLAQVEGKSFDWMMQQLSQLASFKARFPGVSQLQERENLSLDEAVTGFLEFEASVKKSLNAHGYGDDLVTPDAVGALINKGFNAEVVSASVATYKRMEDNAPALQAFNDVLVAQGRQPLSSLQEYFDFLEGKAPADLYDVWEASSIREAADQAGLGDIFSAQDAINTALATEQTLGTANQAMRQAATLLLRLRNEVDVGKFDLDHEELIDISLGQRPRSGRTEADIQESIARAVVTAQGALKDRAKPFTGFTQTGTPQAASLSNLRQTS